MKTLRVPSPRFRPALTVLLMSSVLLLTPGSAPAQPAPGMLDTTFAGSGQSKLGFVGGRQGCNAAAVQADGKLVLAGGTTDGIGGSPYEFEIVRLDTNNLPDLSFGSGGAVFTTFTPEAVFANGASAVAVAIQPDGKIVAGGWGDPTGVYEDFALVRYNPDGSLDSSFGDGGRVLTDFGMNAQINSLAVLADGRIVAAGGAGTNLALARYETNGVLDASFGTGGTVTTDVGGGFEFEVGMGMLVVGGGEYVVVGSGQNGAAIAVARYATNGVLDTTFGGTGVVLTPIPNAVEVFVRGIGYQLGNNTVLNPDKLVVAGGVSYGSSSAFAVARYFLNGSLDTSFGNGGIVTNVFSTTPGSSGGASSVVVQGFSIHPRKITVAGAGTGGFGLARLNADGSLDTTFGGGTGRVTVSVSPPPWYDVSGALVLQGGYYVLGGSSYVTPSTDQRVFTALRFNSDGSLDNTFGSGGVLEVDLAGPGGAGGVALQPDGRFVVAGGVYDGTIDVFALARFNANGTLDGSFGTLGRVVTSVGPTNASANAVLIQPDGKIVAGGWSGTGSGYYYDIGLVRYNPDGSLDGSFGTGGQVITTILGWYDAIQAMALQPDGKIVAAGYSYNFDLVSADFAVVRYQASGALDPSFGGTGKVSTSIAGGLDIGNALALQPDGKIVVAGYGPVGPNTNFALVRYSSDGSLDPAFGTLGRVSTDFGTGNPSYAYGLALQPDGKLIAAGRAMLGGIGYMALTRYLASGTLDSSFGSGGKVTIQLGLTSDQANSVAVLPNGKIVAAGITWQGNLGRFGVARFNPDGSLDNSYGVGGKAVISFNDDYDSGSAVALDQIGRAVLAGGANNLFAVARLTSEPFLKITSITPTNGGQMLLQGLGVPDANHTLYASPSLAPGSFSTVAPFTTDAGGSWQYLDATAAGVAHRSYRFSFP